MLKAPNVPCHLFEIPDYEMVPWHYRYIIGAPIVQVWGFEFDLVGLEWLKLALVLL